MKTLFISLFIGFSGVIFSQSKTEFDQFFNDVDFFMTMYVSLDGGVDYELIKQNKSELDKLTAFINQVNISQVEKEEGYELAFLINSYNLLVVKNILNNPGIQSPQEVGGFFKTDKFTVGNYGKLTLNEIENKKIRNKYNDPRVHFVLVCGAKGCPPLVPFAYVPSKLESQLESQTKIALNNPNFIRVDKENQTIKISQIFKWYSNDFDNTKSFIDSYRTDKAASTYKLSYYDYDWSLNKKATASSVGNTVSVIQAYTPSTLLKKGQIEAQYFNNIYTQTSFRNDKRENVSLNSRQTYYSGLFYALYGVTKSGRLNVGFDVNVKSVRIDPDEKSSSFNVLNFGNDGATSRTAIATVGPKIKFVPVKSWPISIQSAFWIPIASDLEADVADEDGTRRPWLDFNRYTWWNQIFYDRSIGSKFQLFLETDLLFRFGRGKNAYENEVNKQSTLSTPTSAFFSYFPTSKSTLYVMSQYSPTFNLNNYKEGTTELETDVEFANDFAQIGLGGKYQVSTNFSLEVSYTNFITAINGGAGQTFNLGFRWLR